MIEFTPLASSSLGNCYHITDGRTELLLEAGIRLKDLRRKLNFRLSRIAGCLVSHEHADHAGAAHEVMKAGIDVYASQGTFKALGISGHRAKVIKAKQPFEVGTWTIMPFDTVHDAEEPLGFLLASNAGKVLYLTDTAYSKYVFKGLTHVLIECNYSINILNRNIAEGLMPEAMKPRLLRSHLGLETVKDFLMANDLSQVQEIWLLHLSAVNSDEERFKREIQELTGKPVYVAPISR